FWKVICCGRCWPPPSGIADLLLPSWSAVDVRDAPEAQWFDDPRPAAPPAAVKRRAAQHARPAFDGGDEQRRPFPHPGTRDLPDAAPLALQLRHHRADRLAAVDDGPKLRAAAEDELAPGRLFGRLRAAQHRTEVDPCAHDVLGVDEGGDHPALNN